MTPGQRHPLHPLVILSGIIVAVVGAVIAAIIIGEGRFAPPVPTPINLTQTATSNQTTTPKPNTAGLTDPTSTPLEPTGVPTVVAVLTSTAMPAKTAMSAPEYTPTATALAATSTASPTQTELSLSIETPTPESTTDTNLSIAESDHPYANSEEKSWVISNDTGSDAMRVHFGRIELEDGVDRLEVSDEQDKLIQVIEKSFLDGAWSDMVPGAIAKVTLRSDASGQAWGFAVDRLEAAEYPTIGYSAHPYGNGLADAQVFNNDSADQSGTKLQFDRIHMEEGVDYIVIQDAGGVPYQWITGNYESGLETEAVPGPVIRAQLFSDESGQAWGYNVVSVKGAPSDQANPAPEWPQSLAESNHPYEPELAKVWTITNPDATSVSSKVHFSRLDLNNFDAVQVLDANDTVIQTFAENTHKADFWSDYVPGRVVKIKLIAIPGYEDWGFRVDAIVNSVANPGLAQSNHPYEPTLVKVWTITNPDATSVSSKVHFSRLDLNNFDAVQVLDANDTVIQTFVENTHKTDFWSDYVPGRVVKINLIANPGYEDWGFRVDAIVNSVANPGLAQSNHPYEPTLVKVWMITNPDATSVSSKVHFSRLDLNNFDAVQILDANDAVIQTFVENTHKTDFWSDYVPGRVVKINLIANPGYEDWGFRVDAIQSK